MLENMQNFEEQVGRQWGLIALRGVLSIIFGIMAIIWPFAAIWALAMLWGAFALVDGATSIAAAWRMHKNGAKWGAFLFLGIIGVAAGIIAIVWPLISAVAFVFIISFWALLGGICQVVAAFRLRKAIQGEVFLFLSGAISIIFGLLLFLHPLPEGVLAIAWMVGIFAVIVGIFYLMLAYRVHKATRSGGY